MFFAKNNPVSFSDDIVLKKKFSKTGFFLSDFNQKSQTLKTISVDGVNHNELGTQTHVENNKSYTTAATITYNIDEKLSPDFLNNDFIIYGSFSFGKTTNSNNIYRFFTTLNDFLLIKSDRNMVSGLADLVIKIKSLGSVSEYRIDLSQFIDEEINFCLCSDLNSFNVVVNGLVLLTISRLFFNGTVSINQMILTIKHIYINFRLILESFIDLDQAKKITKNPFELFDSKKPKKQVKKLPPPWRDIERHSVNFSTIER